MSDETKSASTEPKKCSACAVELVADAAFCHRCGKSTEGGAPAAGSAEELPLWKGRYSFKSLGGWFILLVVWWIGMLALMLFVWRPDLTNKWLAALFIAMAVVPLKVLLGVYLRNRLKEAYTLTSHKVARHSGILGRKLEEMDLAKVTDVTVEQSLLQRIFNAGQVTVFSSGEATARLVMRGVDEPLRLKDWIRKHAEARRRR